MASNREIRAVRKVLYDRRRLRKLDAHLTSIDVLMNFDPNATLPPDDIRVAPGAGPTWFIPGTGELNSGVREAAQRCDRVAGLLREIRRELADVSFDGADKRHLRGALEAQAKAFSARGRLWGAPGRPDAEAGAPEIVGHEAEALRHFKRVKPYLHEVDVEDFR
jgi:hypothetical protein